MVVIKQFAAEFKIKLIAELGPILSRIVFCTAFSDICHYQTYFHLSDFLSSLIFQFTGNSITTTLRSLAISNAVCFSIGIFVISQLYYDCFLFIIKK